MREDTDTVFSFKKTGDAVLILGYVFLRDEPPVEPGPVECGYDVEPDTLSICNGSGCG